MRSKDSSLRSSPADTVTWLFGKDEQRYKEMYCVLPFGINDLAVFLMNDCGKSVEENTFAEYSFSEFCSIFADFWKQTISLCDIIFHGDVLPHNLVYNKSHQKLVLVDLDEGTVAADAPIRIFQDENSERFPYLRYPNYLRARSQAKLYTKIQLLFSFLMLVDPWRQQEKERLDKLDMLANTAHQYLKSMDQSTKGSQSDESGKCLDDAVDALQRVLINSDS